MTGFHGIGFAAIVLAMAGASVMPAEAAGALAVGACGAYGQAYDFNAVRDARVGALKQCPGAACKVVAITRKGCAAFVIDANNPCGPYGYATAARLGRAQNLALKQCYKFGGHNCVVRSWFCDAKG